MHSTRHERRATRRPHHISAALALGACLVGLGAAGCVTFDEYPEGRLCKDPFRDADGRAIFYPESALCLPELDAGPEPTPATSEEDGGAE